MARYKKIVNKDLFNFKKFKKLLFETESNFLSFQFMALAWLFLGIQNPLRPDYKTKQFFTINYPGILAFFVHGSRKLPDI